MLEASEFRLAQMGRAGLAKILAGIREELGADLAFPASFGHSSEALTTVRAFSPESRQALEAEGHVVYSFRGQSIEGMRKAGRPFWNIVDAGPQFLALPSRLIEVAINPDPKKFFLPKSNNKTLPQQEEMIAIYSEELRGKTGSKDIAAIMGEAPDYVELAFVHLDATRDRLFGERYDYRYARTKTPTVGSDVAVVGGFLAGHGLGVGGWDRDRGCDIVWAVPLVVPVENR